MAEGNNKSSRQSFARHICPVTRRHVDVPLSSVPVGMFEIIDEPDGLLPLHFGRLIIEVAIPHPDVAQRADEAADVEAQREASLQEYLQSVKREIEEAIGDIDAMNLTPTAKEALLAKRAAMPSARFSDAENARDKLTDGSLVRQLRRQIAKQLPLPGEAEQDVAHLRCEVQSLHVDAIAMIIENLRKLGVPVGELPKEDE